MILTVSRYIQKTIKHLRTRIHLKIRLKLIFATLNQISNNVLKLILLIANRTKSINVTQEIWNYWGMDTRKEFAECTRTTSRMEE